MSKTALYSDDISITNKIKTFEFNKMNSLVEGDKNKYGYIYLYPHLYQYKYRNTIDSANTMKQ